MWSVKVCEDDVPPKSGVKYLFSSKIFSMTLKTNSFALIYSIWHFCFPSHFNNSATEKINTVFTLDQLRNYFLPSNVPSNSSPYLCKRNSDKFDSHGVNFINDVSKDCIQNNNNATIKYPNTPYDAPGVVTKRVDFNAYDWMKNPVASGNILYSHGF